MSLYTKQGIPLQEIDSYVFTSAGIAVGQRRNDKVFGPDGRYVGTIVDDRLVYREDDSVCIGSPFTVANCDSYHTAHAGSSDTPGEEPHIPDYAPDDASHDASPQESHATHDIA
jgi:hypothetical protein